ERLGLATGCGDLDLDDLELLRGAADQRHARAERSELVRGAAADAAAPRRSRSRPCRRTGQDGTRNDRPAWPPNFLPAHAPLVMPADCTWPDACLVSFQHGLRGRKLQPGPMRLIGRGASRDVVPGRERKRANPEPMNTERRWSWIPALASLGRNDQADVLQC